MKIGFIVFWKINVSSMIVPLGLRAETQVLTIDQIIESDTRTDLSFKTLHYVIVSNLADLELFSHIQSPWFESPLLLHLCKYNPSCI